MGKTKQKLSNILQQLKGCIDFKVTVSQLKVTKSSIILQLKTNNFSFFNCIKYLSVKKYQHNMLKI